MRLATILAIPALVGGALWIYVGTDVTRPLFADTTGVARVQLRVK